MLGGYRARLPPFNVLSGFSGLSSNTSGIRRLPNSWHALRADNWALSASNFDGLKRTNLQEYRLVHTSFVHGSHKYCDIVG